MATLYTFLAAAFYRSVFMWDPDKSGTFLEDSRARYINLNCLIIIAKISSTGENWTMTLLATVEHVPVETKMAVLISDRDIFSENPGFHKLVALTINLGKSMYVLSLIFLPIHTL